MCLGDSDWEKSKHAFKSTVGKIIIGAGTGAFLMSRFATVPLANPVTFGTGKIISWVVENTKISILYFIEDS